MFDPYIYISCKLLTSLSLFFNWHSIYWKHNQEALWKNLSSKMSAARPGVTAPLRTRLSSSGSFSITSGCCRKLWRMRSRMWFHIHTCSWCSLFLLSSPHSVVVCRYWHIVSHSWSTPVPFLDDILSTWSAEQAKQVTQIALKQLKDTQSPQSTVL